ncbi:TlpA disulfide reductase family protein [Maribacter sp. TH_r10]|uniref:TlpA disulfide reductase family protein n=1 Tax=Maribacter sp. TH_r10 TaxID=3082086 RepID=UPI002954F5D9|nr:TlpA disulfide reductase family protein [Maribacter sp. TH_r10]MDV7139128.1 TlpA disulfide reductase family protein [Maribacter sp. TH_r10]
MRLLTKLIFFPILVSLFNCSPKERQVLQLNGTVINSETKSILLLKPNQDSRFDSLIEIPVKNGTFHYTEQLKNPEVVNLAFAESVKKGAFRPMRVFLENENIDLTIYPEEEFDKNVVEGGSLNAEYKNYQQNLKNRFFERIKPLNDSISALHINYEYNSDKVRVLYDKLQEIKNQEQKIVVYKKIDELRKVNQHLSPKAQILEEKLKSIYDEINKFQQEYIENNPTIVSYSFLLENLIYYKETLDVNSTKNAYSVLSKANPDHPYNDLAFSLINAIENVKVGKKYIDFSAPDLNGNEVKLSDKIDGKVALLDLWATWCSPCIANSRKMVPVFEEFKDKGFTIVGVAGEFKNTTRLIEFLEKEKWHWLNLVELDRKNGIWQKYGVDGGGGGMFLIDDNGIILAKDPTAEEAKQILESRLN